MLDQIVQAFEEGEHFLQDFVTILLRFQKETRIQILDATKYTLAELIEKTSIVPFSDQRLLRFKVDQLRDAEAFTDWTLNEMYSVCDGRLLI